MMRPLTVLALLAVVGPARAQLPLLYPLVSPGSDAGGQFGTALASVPDVDGDGRADILVGAPGEDTSFGAGAGRAYVFSGATGAPLDTLVSPGGRANGQFGCAVAGVPDLNGDGRGEALVGACGEGSPGTDGRVYLLSGRTEALLRTFVSPNAQDAGCFGCAVAALPDVNGDGAADLFFGASREGRAYVYSGASGALLRTLTSPSPVARGFFGADVAAVPDADGDGRADLLVGEQGVRTVAPDPNPSVRGRAYLFSGSTGALLHTLAGLIPTLTGTLFGTAVAGVPDVTGDGRGDLVVGASQEFAGSTSRAGGVYLFDGATGARVYTSSSPAPEVGGAFGQSVSVVPDLTGDGRSDLLIGGPAEDGGAVDAGRAYLLSGSDGAVFRALTSPNPTASGSFGGSVVAGPDADGDGRADLFAGAPAETGDGGQGDAGRAYLFSTSPIVAGEPGTGPAALVLTATPNPVRGAVTLAFTLVRGEPIRLAVFDALGREVAVLVDGARPAGRHEARVDAGRLAPGVYLARLTSEGTSVSRVIAVVR